MKTLAVIIFFALACGAGLAQTPPGAGYAIYMDQDDKIDIGNHYSNLNFPFTFSCWVKTDTTGSYPLFASADRSQSNQGFWIDLNFTSVGNLEILFNYGDGSSLKTFRANSLGQQVIARWLHLSIIARSASDIIILINGLETSNLVVTGSATSLSSGNGPGFIGYDTLVQAGFYGVIDEVAIWNKALTYQEIRSNMCRTLKGNEANLFGYYNFDTPSSFILHDNSLNNHQGTIYGARTILSWAPLGDQSNFEYGLQSLSVSNKSQAGDSIYASFSVSPVDSNGLHVYIIEKKPFPRPSGYQIPPSVNFYFGIFAANQSASWREYDAELYIAPPLTAFNTYTALSKSHYLQPWTLFGQISTNNPIINLDDVAIYTHGVIVNRCPIFHILPQETLACDSVQLSVPSKYDSLQWDDGSTAYTRSITASGTYWFTAYDSISDCPVSDTIEVTLLSDQTISVLPNDTLLCPGDSLLLDATLPGASGYLWNTGDTAAHLTVKDSGLYSVQVNIDSACFAYDSIRVSYSSFKDVVQDSSYLQCESDSVLVQLNPQDWQSATWSNGSTGLQSYFAEGGQYWVSATNYDGCSLTDTFNLEVISPGDSIPIFPDTSFCLSEPLLLRTPAGFTATWPNGSDSLYLVEESETIKLLIGNGCEDTSYYFQATLENCSCEVKIPDAFTPNGDGLNDIFKPVTECNYLQYELSIFDRWGKKLFQTTETGRGFDGNFNGRKLGGGVYLYRFQYKTEHTSGDLSGYFVLVR